MSRAVNKRIEVSWGDLDAFNHVNHAAFLRYMEDARMEWLTSLEGTWQSAGHGPVVVNININYRREILFPATVNVRLTVSQASAKRILHQYTITDIDQPDTVYADADLTLVWIDRATGRSIPVPGSVEQSMD